MLVAEGQLDREGLLVSTHLKISNAWQREYIGCLQGKDTIISYRRRPVDLEESGCTLRFTVSRLNFHKMTVIISPTVLQSWHVGCFK